MAVVKGATVNARENNIDKALLRAQAAVAGVQKNARNDFAGYDYVSADGMVGQLRQILLNEGLVFGRRTWEIVEDNVVSHLFLSHAESGERWQWTASMPIVITKGRPADKSVLGALTTCLSYVLRDLLLVPRVDPAQIPGRWIWWPRSRRRRGPRVPPAKHGSMAASSVRLRWRSGGSAL